MSGRLFVLFMLTAATPLAAQSLKFTAVKVGDGINDVRIVPWQLSKMPSYEPSKNDYSALDPADAAAVKYFASQVIDPDLGQEDLRDIASIRIVFSSTVAGRVEEELMPMATARQYLTNCKSFEFFSLGISDADKSVHYALVKFSCPTAEVPDEGALVGLQLRNAKVRSIYAGETRPVFLSLKNEMPSNEAYKN